MNEFCVLLYVMLYKMRYLNLNFKYIPVLHRANFSSLSVKKGDTNRFLYNGES